MFDWIGDAINWIGDGISSLWDNTVGSAVDAITDEIWNIMFEWLFNLIYGAVADLFEFINASTSSIFALSWVQSFIALFHSLERLYGGKFGYCCSAKTLLVLR